MKNLLRVPHTKLENVTIVVRKRDDEYEVVPMTATGGRTLADENATYYTNDRDDAIATAEAMAVTYK